MKMKSHKFPFTIAWADTDAAGIVYHAKFIEIAERARLDWFKDEMKKSLADGGFIIKKISIKYDLPLQLMDEIIVESRTTNVGASLVDIEQKFMRGDDVCAVMNIRVVYVDAVELKPKRIPENWLSKL